jgi:hypothetical protein
MEADIAVGGGGGGRRPVKPSVTRGTKRHAGKTGYTHHVAVAGGPSLSIISLLGSWYKVVISNRQLRVVVGGGCFKLGLAGSCE